MDNIYPIGSVFITTNTTNPSIYFGGKWERIKGRFLLGADDSNYKIGAVGGEAAHILTINEIPAHGHSQVGSILNSSGPYNVPLRGAGWSASSTGVNTINTGGGQAHNNMPPYLVVYMWKRIS